MPKPAQAPPAKQFRVRERCPRPYCGGNLMYDEDEQLRCLLCNRLPE